ncbi:MAG: hypothetical protein AB8H79_11175 [Myxococcota bacterium]
MLALADTTAPLERELLDAKGGFAWWYLDLLDDDHNGCVLIWSFGLPFLPGRESASRAGRPIPCREQPSVNVVVFREGKPDLYVLQQHPEKDAVWEPGTEDVRIGRSTFSSRREGDRRICIANLDLDLPDGKVLTGSVQVRGAAAQVAPSEPDPNHQWSLLCTATRGQARLSVDGAPFLDIEARAYHDRNGSVAPLDGLGIRHWLWGRAPWGDRERIWYLLWPHTGEPVAWGLDVGPDGSTRVVSDLGIRRQGFRLGRFGMPWHRRLELSHNGEPWLVVTHDKTVDNGFFYQRWLTRTEAPDGSVGAGTAESVRPGRVDRAWSRWLVSMAVDRVGRQNSRFIRLFSGAKTGDAPALLDVESR